MGQKLGGVCVPFSGDSWVCIDQDAIGTEVGLGLRDIVLDGDQLPCPKGAHPRPNFWPMSAVAKPLDELRCHLVWR